LGRNGPDPKQGRGTCLARKGENKKTRWKKLTMPQIDKKEIAVDSTKKHADVKE